MRQALLILDEDEDEREQEPFSFGKKCPGLWLHLPPVFNVEGVIRLGKSGNCKSLLGTLFEPPDPFIHNCLAHFYFVIFYDDNKENLFNITLNCLRVSQATTLYIIFIKL